MKKLIILFVLILGSYSGTLAQQPAIVVSDKGGWHKIGETTVNFKTESDEIMVIGADRFKYIKIKVTDASINLISFVVHFESGGIQNVDIGKEIKAAGETRIVELSGGEQRIKKITFTYKTLPNAMDKKASVELWGLKTNEDKDKGK